jgi:hypothetical protein
MIAHAAGTQGFRDKRINPALSLGPFHLRIFA